jgi:hypothetical protein
MKQAFFCTCSRRSHVDHFHDESGWFYYDEQYNLYLFYVSESYIIGNTKKKRANFSELAAERQSKVYHV